MLKQNIMRYFFFIMLIGVASTNANGQDDAQAIGIPSATLLFSMSQSASANSSSILGGELQFNIKSDGVPFAIGLHGLYQSQSFSTVDTSRWGYGASVNGYQQVGVGLFYLGYKKLFYSGGGKKEML